MSPAGVAGPILGDLGARDCVQPQRFLSFSRRVPPGRACCSETGTAGIGRPGFTGWDLRRSWWEVAARTSAGSRLGARATSTARLAVARRPLVAGARNRADTSPPAAAMDDRPCGTLRSGQMGGTCAAAARSCCFAPSSDAPTGPAAPASARIVQRCSRVTLLRFGRWTISHHVLGRADTLVPADRAARGFERCGARAASRLGRPRRAGCRCARVRGGDSAAVH
jgi:hypothetical protein